MVADSALVGDNHNHIMKGRAISPSGPSPFYNVALAARDWVPLWLCNQPRSGEKVTLKRPSNFIGAHPAFLIPHNMGSFAGELAEIITHSAIIAMRTLGPKAISADATMRCMGMS
jgi:hypothetical protein